MLLVKLKVQVTASFSAALRDMTSVSARFQESGHAYMAPMRETKASLRNV